MRALLSLGTSKTATPTKERNFHIRSVHPAIIKVFYYQLMHRRIVFKRVLKFTLKLQ